MRRIGIIDYGVGNLFSLSGAINKLGHTAVVSRTPEELAKTDKLILPGVGSYGEGVRNLNRFGLRDPLNNLVVSGIKPVLGICLGAQLMMSTSDEAPGFKGLDWLAGDIKKIKPSDDEIRIPHIGWNEVFYQDESALFIGIPDRTLFYFVHGYYINPRDDSIIRGYFDHGTRMCAAVEKGHVFATQFHPEKSQKFGLKLLENFVNFAMPD